MNKRAVIWVAWGEKYVYEAVKSCNTLKSGDYAKILITDNETFDYAKRVDVFDKIIKAHFQLVGLCRKSEMWKFIPDNFDSYLFLDVDTRILDDISFGFEMAEKWGLAMVPAAHYCLDYFWGFDKVMISEGVMPKGQMQYNSGIIFFTLTEEVLRVFEKWNELAEKYAWNQIPGMDQPLLTLAMELLDFRPYVLSLNYNYRGMGVPIIGNVRIWHVPHEPPAELNDQPGWWPMRYFVNGKFYRPGYRKWKFKQYLKSIIKNKLFTR